MKRKDFLSTVFLLLIGAQSYHVALETTNLKDSMLREKSHGSPIPVYTNSGFRPVYVYRGQSSDPIQTFRGLTARREEEDPKFIVGSQIRQDRVVSALTEALESKNGTKSRHYFVELAANDAVQLSNTLQLERKGWEGVCVEPNSMYWFGLSHRKCNVVGAFIGGVVDGNTVNVSLSNKALGGIIGKDFDNKGDEKDVVLEKRLTVSIRTLFDTFEVPKEIDYLSLDVEGAEELIMKDFPFDTYTINILTIERPNRSLQSLLKSKNYHFVQLLVHWGETLWVHESVLPILDIESIKKIAEAQDLPERKRKPSWSIERGDWRKKRKKRSPTKIPAQ